MLKSTEKQRHYCCVCSNYTGKIVNGQVVQLHRFPANVTIKRSWLRRIKLVYGNYTNSNNDRLCSVHFTGGRKTKNNDIPNIFDSKTFKKMTSAPNETAELDTCKVIQDPVTSNADNSLENDIEAGPAFITDECSALNTSVMLHDYCGPVKDVAQYLNKLEQTDILLVTNSSQTISNSREFGTQTDFVYIVSEPVTPTPNISTKVKHAGLQAAKPDITIEDVYHRDDKVMFYTGVPNGKTFMVLFDEMNDVYNTYDAKKGGRPRNLRAIDEFFMVLMRLRLGLLIEDLSDRFKISKGTCSTIISLWVDYLYIKLSFLIVWPKQKVNCDTMPKQFKSKYPTCRVIIDCTELFTQTPQSLANKTLMYSSYKSHMTYKALLGINPLGIITFVSNLWSGGTSDKQLTKRCGILDLCERGDSIMADKGFLISDLTTPRGIRLIIPPLKYTRFTRRQVEETRRIANLRIHVERAMERVKNFRILQGDIPITLSGQVSKLWKICACLSNLQPPLVNDN